MDDTDHRNCIRGTIDAMNELERRIIAASGAQGACKRRPSKMEEKVEAQE